MTKVINLRKYTKAKVNKNEIKYNKTPIKEERYKIILLVVTVFSILLGCIIYKYNNNTVFIDFNDYISRLKTINIIDLFINVIRFDITFYVIVFFIGTSFIGKILVFIPPMLKALLVGYVSSYLYCEYKTNGIMFCLIALYPFLVITTSTLIFAANESAYMSNYVKDVITHKCTSDNMSIKLYIIRFIILLAINIVCAFLNSLFIAFIVPRINLF